MRSVTVHRGGSPTTRWAAAFGTPGPALAGLVDGYAEYDEWSASPVRRAEPPGPSTVLIVELDGPLHIRGAEEPDLVARSAFVGGPGPGPARTWHAGRQHCVEVRLTPFGAYRLFGAVPDLAGRIVTLADAWGRPGVALAERLADGAGCRERFDVLDETLGALADGGPRPCQEVVHAWRRLTESGGAARIADLAEEVGWSRTRFATRFRAQTGRSPKAAAAALRLDRAVTRLSTSDLSLAEIALGCGYYDQAHLNRDFRELTGCTPAEWRRAQGEALVGAVLPA